MVIPLGREPAAGHIAFTSFVPAGGAPPGELAAAIANVVVRPGHVPYAFGPEPRDSAPPGLLTRWQLSPTFEVKPGPVTSLPANLLASKATWPTFAVEPTGVVVVDRRCSRLGSVAFGRHSSTGDRSTTARTRIA